MKTSLIAQYLIGLGGLFITFITPIYGMVFLMAFSVILDTVFAIYWTIKLKGRRAFTSHKLFNIVPKLIMYIGCILLSFLIDKFILEGEIYDIKLLVTKLVTAVFVYIEAKSIDETSQKLGNKPFLEIIKSLFNKIKGFKKDLNDIK
jgi:hypothetical protein